MTYVLQRNFRLEHVPNNEIAFRLFVPLVLLRWFLLVARGAAVGSHWAPEIRNLRGIHDDGRIVSHGVLEFW